MSLYTLSLNAIINIHSQQENALFNDKIENGIKVLFNFDMPINDNIFIELFEKAFIIKYINRSICYNTCDRWLFQLENDIKIKMPLYYKKYSIIKNLKEEDITKGDTNTIISKTNDKGKNINSDFPQEIPKAININNVKYMNNGQMAENQSENMTTSTSTLNKLERLSLYENQIKDIISEFVDSFEDLFLFLY